VLAAWNAEAFIPAVIDQIQAQTLGDFEVIVVDDASTDATAEGLKDWAAADPRVTVLRNPDRVGVAASRNRALDVARGTYVWFADCDDQWSATILEHLVARAEETQCDVVVAGARSVRATGETVGMLPGSIGAPVSGPADGLRRLLRGEIQGHLWNKLFRRSLFEGVRFPGTWAYSDMGAMGWLLARARSIELLDEPLYTYVIRPGSILNSRKVRLRDLLDIRTEVAGAKATLPATPEFDRDFTIFAYTMVYLPTLHSIIRHGADDDEARAVKRETFQAVHLADAATLVKGGALRPALATYAARWAFPVYAAAYRLFRRLKWGSVGYWSR
jgi:glycosyltransferase involved in cell wall biosynthesis